MAKSKNIMENINLVNLKFAVDSSELSLREETKTISKEKNFVEHCKEVHQHISDNLEYYRKKMLEHQEEQKKFVQSYWGIATCGYCFKDKFQKSWMYVGNEELHEIVCKSCLFKNKIWKEARI